MGAPRHGERGAVVAVRPLACCATRSGCASRPLLRSGGRRWSPGTTDHPASPTGIPVGLKRWTWEDAGRTRGAEPVKWQVENEYHVQNLLYVLLAPIFNDIADEVNLQPVGQKNPRIDLYLPSLHTIIEVKYRKDVKKSFPTLIGEIAEDASLYRADTKYKDARIVSFLWDRTRATQEHAKFKEGVLKIDGIDGCVVISAPSTMS